MDIVKYAMKHPKVNDGSKDLPYNWSYEGEMTWHGTGTHHRLLIWHEECNIKFDKIENNQQLLPDKKL